MEITEVGEVQSVFALDRYRIARRLAREWRPDIIHGAVMEGTVLASVTGVLTRTPVVVEETSDPANRRLFGHILARTASIPANRCIAVSPFVGRYLIDRLHMPPSKVRVIVNGVRVPETVDASARTALRRDLGGGDDDVIVGTVCRLFDDHKRVSDLIRAIGMLLLSDDRPRVHLLVVGDGPDAESLRRQAAQTAEPRRFHFVGEQVPADAYYGVMDVFALASAREAFGLVAAEAMLAGLPVVASRVGGLTEIVEHEVTGILVPPLAPGSLAEALRRLATDRGLRERMGTAGRSRAERLYTVERYVSEIATLYREVIAAPGRLRS